MAEQETQEYKISIHAPPRGATRAALGDGIVAKISIHAPPRGATPSTPKSDYSTHISIHAPPRGATPALCASNLVLKHFNSRPSARGDIIFSGVCGCHTIYFNSRPSARGDAVHQQHARTVGISIHAPPRGATSRNAQSPNSQFYFNSRPSARGDGTGLLLPDS